jgi:hypothetical protein
LRIYGNCLACDHRLSEICSSTKAAALCTDTGCRKLEGVVGTGWSWLRIGTGGGHL